MSKQYAERDIEEQKYYAVHVSAMTGEKLHSKSDIAAELAHRDEEIERLNKALGDIQRHQFTVVGSEWKARQTGAFQIAEKAMKHTG